MMTTHNERDDELMRAYLDDELSAAEARDFEARLASEPTLQAEFESYRRTVQMLRQVGPMEAPESLLPAVQRRISGRGMRSHLDPHLRFPFEVLVFVALLAAIFILYFDMAPDGVGRIGQKTPSAVVQVDLRRPAPATLIEEYELAPARWDARPFETAYFGTFERSRAEDLLRTIEPLAQHPVSLTGKGPRFTVLLVAPRSR